MSTLTTLIRLARQQVDETQRALGQVEERRAGLARREADLERSIADEQAAANAHVDAMFAYGEFAHAAILARRAFLREAADLHQSAAALRNDLAEAYIELKKLETLEEREIARDRARAAAAEAQEMDEIAIRMGAAGRF